MALGLSGCLWLPTFLNRRLVILPLGQNSQRLVYTCVWCGDAETEMSPIPQPENLFTRIMYANQ